jgi:hypothetical protein
MNDGCQVIQGQVQDECQGMKLGLSCAGSPTQTCYDFTPGQEAANGMQVQWSEAL